MIYGTTPDGRDFEIFTLSYCDLDVSISNYGARLVSFKYRGQDLLYGPKTAEAMLADECYCGAICGRVANRIAGGSFSLDGRDYKLAVNNGPNHLHGGLVGFSSRIWTVEKADDLQLVLSLVSPDGEEGYPGTVHLRAEYSLNEQELCLRLEASTDAPTLLNLTNHAYWNLKGKGTIDDHSLMVNADQYTPMVANIPTGAIAPVEGTLYDLRREAKLGLRNAPGAIAGGYDDNYVLDNGGEPAEAAVLSAGDLCLRVLTDAPGLQVYTGDYLPLKRGGVALEAQSFPDSPHHPNFPSIELRPGQNYCRNICWLIDGLW